MSNSDFRIPGEMDYDELIAHFGDVRDLELNETLRIPSMEQMVHRFSPVQAIKRVFGSFGWESKTETGLTVPKASFTPEDALALRDSDFEHQQALNPDSVGTRDEIADMLPTAAQVTRRMNAGK